VRKHRLFWFLAAKEARFRESLDAKKRPSAACAAFQAFKPYPIRDHERLKRE